MAVDGSLIFNTKIDTDGIIKGEKELSSKIISIKNKMVDVQNQAKNVKAELEKMADVPVDTSASKAVEKKIETLKAEIETAKDAFNKAEAAISYRSTDSKGNFDYKAFEARQKSDPEYKAADEQLTKLNAKLKQYQLELQNTRNAENQITGKDTAAYKQKQEQLEKLSLEFAKYEAELREAEQAESRTSLQTAASSNKLAFAKKQLERTISALKMFANGAKRAGNVLKTAFSKVAGKLIQNIGAHFRNANKSTNVLEKSLRRIKSTLVSMFFLRMVHSPFNAVKDGLKDIAKVSPTVNKNLSALQTESTYLKNSFVSLVTPLVNLLTPAFTGFMQTLSAVTDKAAQLVAILTGQSTYTKAIKVQHDYAESLDETTKSAKENQKALAGFDELNVLETSSDSDDSSAMFQNVDAQIDSLSKTLLDAFKNQDFEAVGKMVGEKINSALSKIKWGKIKATLKSWASNIAGFLNGFISGIDWNLLGATLANGLGAALTFAQTLVRGFDFSAFGTAIGDLINGFISPENAAMLADTVSRFFSGMLDMMTSLVSTVDWGKVTSAIISFISNFRISDIANSATRLINSFATSLTKLDFKAIGTAFSKGLSRINWRGIWNSVTRLFTNALQGLTDFFGLKGVSTSNLNTALKNIYTPVSELYNTLKDSVSELLVPIINDFLPAAIGLIGSILGGIKPIIKAVTPIFKKTIEVVSQIAKSLAPVVETLGRTIGKIVENLTPMISPLLDLIGNVVDFLAPAVDGIFRVVGGISGLLSPIFGFVGDIFGLLSGGDDAPTISAKLQEELDHLAEVSGSLTTVSSNIDNAISAVDESLSGTANDYQIIEDLKSRMAELMGQATISDEEFDEMLTIADVLKDKLPGFKEEWDKIVGEDGLNKQKFIDNKDEMSKAIQSVIDNLEKQYITEALSEQKKAILTEKTQATIDYNKAMEDLTAAHEEYRKKMVEASDAEEYRKKLQDEYDSGNKELKESLDSAIEKEEEAKTAAEEYGKSIEEMTGNALIAKAKLSNFDEKLSELNNTVKVATGEYDKNKDGLQALRDAFNLGFIDADKLEKDFGLTTDQLLKSTLSSAEQVTEGYRKAISDGVVKIKNDLDYDASGLTESIYNLLSIDEHSLNQKYEAVGENLTQGLEKGVKKGNAVYEMGLEVSEDAEGGVRDGSETQSPSRAWGRIGVDLVDGLIERGIEKRTPKLISVVKSLAETLTATMRAGLSQFDSLFDSLPELLTHRLNLALDAFEQFLSRITSGMNETLLQINALNKAFATSGGGSGTYTTWQAMNPITIPRLATGTVVPANYGQFLAILGDNKREAEVVSPVSKIEEAVENVLNRRGDSSDRPIYVTVVCEDGSVLLETVGKADDNYAKRHGNSRFYRRGSE